MKYKNQYVINMRDLLTTKRQSIVVWRGISEKPDFNEGMTGCSEVRIKKIKTWLSQIVGGGEITGVRRRFGGQNKVDDRGSRSSTR